MQITGKRVSRKQTNRRVSSEWYECTRCGFNYPRGSIIVQNGLILCTGPNTTECYDLKGAGAYRSQLGDVTEKPIPDLPFVDEDL